MVTNEYNIYSKNKAAPLFKLFNSSASPCERVYREHHHTAFEISLFKSGSGIYRVGSKNYRFNKNDIFLFGSNEAHCITKIDDGCDMLLMNLHFEPRFIWSNNNLFDYKFLKIFTSRNSNFQNMLPRESPATKEIKNLLLGIENEFIESKTGFELMAKTDLLKILVTLIRGYDFVSDETQDFSVRNQNLYNLDMAMNYIDKNMTSEISLDDLAAISGMSRTYFSALFKKMNGLSPWDYITIRRIEAATELLKHSDATVLDIACSCGFNNTANFNRAFKKVTGRTPSQYRV